MAVAPSWHGLFSHIPGNQVPYPIMYSAESLHKDPYSAQRQLTRKPQSVQNPGMYLPSACPIWGLHMDTISPLSRCSYRHLHRGVILSCLSQLFLFWFLFFFFNLLRFPRPGFPWSISPFSMDYQLHLPQRSCILMFVTHCWSHLTTLRT